MVSLLVLLPFFIDEFAAVGAVGGGVVQGEKPGERGVPHYTATYVTISKGRPEGSSLLQSYLCRD